RCPWGGRAAGSCGPIRPTRRRRREPPAPRVRFPRRRSASPYRARSARSAASRGGSRSSSAPRTRGRSSPWCWTYPVFEEHWNYGFPQEMRHFARCVRGKETPVSDGETGRVVQEVLYAAYASAGLGRKIMLPFCPKGIQKPIDLWKTPERAQAAL